MGEKNKSLKIVILSFDWNNNFENNFELLKNKLSRDRLGAEINDFFMISWSNVGYYGKHDNIQSLHIKVPKIFGIRFICDFLSPVIVPVVLLKHRFFPDIFLIYDFPMSFGGLSLRFFTKTKIVLFLTNIPNSLMKTRSLSAARNAYWFLAKFLGKYAINKFIVISLTTKNFLIKGGIKEDNIEITIPRVFGDVPDLITYKHKDIRSVLGVPANSKIILSVGRLEKEKCYSELIEGFSKLDIEDLYLVIVGSGKLEFELKKKADDSGVASHIVFAGFVPHKDLWDYYLSSDVFMLLSQTEGLGLVFWEAMHCGVPVLGKNIEGIAETIGKDGERGFYWEGKDGVKRLEKIILKCLSSSNEMEEVKSRAREYVKLKEDFNKTINDLI